MSHASIAKSLGKVLIGLAWADGQIQPAEKECLKDLVFHLPELSSVDIDELKHLLEDPVGSAEREIFLIELTEQLKFEKEKEYALYALDRIAHADGTLTKSEEHVLEAMRTTIECIKTKSFGRVEELLKGPLTRRSRASSTAVKADAIDRFTRRQVTRMKKEKGRLELNDEELKKLALAGFLMARVVQADKRIRDSEVRLLHEFIGETWGLEKDAAIFATNICLSGGGNEVNLVRACRVFYDLTTEEERVAFLDILFRVAMADGTLSEDEIQEVINIAANLKLEQNYFHEALARME